MPDPDESTEPRWTTGQGLGFLVMLPGLIVTALGLTAMLVSAFAIEDRDDMLIGIASGGGVVFLGLIAAIPGLVVFTRCAKNAP